MECPCYVSVKTDTQTDCLVSFFSSDGTLLERRTIAAAELRSGENYTKVKKGDIYVSVLQNMGGMLLTGGRVVQCQTGRESEPIYSCSVPKTAVGDDLLVEGILQKQHAVVTLIFKNTSETVYPYNVKVSSSCNGLDLLSLKGTKGEFTLQPSIDAEMKTKFTMSRQLSTEPIYLYFLDKLTGAAVATLDLSYYIGQTGYNWDAEYLADITITIDYARMSLSIQVADWEEVLTFKFVI